VYYDNRGTGSASPFNPYSGGQYQGQPGQVHGQAQAQGHGGFFIPARSSKISIRAPGDHDKAEMSEGGVVDGPGGYASIARRYTSRDKARGTILGIIHTRVQGMDRTTVAE
jgi:hypothetical protein